MSERLRSDSARYQTNSTKMSEGDLGTRKTLFVLVIVVGCFAVLWPKVFYPMLVGPTNQRMKPSNLDKGCCDVISDIDVNTIKIMSELCNNIIQQNDEKPLKGQEIITRCRAEVLNKCGIDISAVLQEQVRLGRSFKQIVDEVRSFNGSLCLKYNFGVSPWRLGVSHRVVNLSPAYIRQERPAHLRPEMLHPALREKGRAIAQPYQPPAKGSQPKFVDGRPGPVPGVRPPMGAGAGQAVHPQQKGINSMGVIMPIYTIGIVIFFSYTLMKLLFKKKPEGPGGGLYPPVEPSMSFRREVFESEKSRAPRQPGSIVNAMSALLDEVDQELEARRKANEATSQKEPTSNGTLLANGSAKQSQEHEQPSVKVLGMEMTASCEGGEKWSRPESPVIPNTPPPPPEPVEPPQEIYLEGALPAQSQLLVADSTTEPEPNESSSCADPAVVLASKMTLSVISLDSQESENGVEPVEGNKLRNGDLIDTEHEALDDEIVDESKYTTASGATAAERDISEEERTEGEDDMEEEIEKVPEFVVDNGVQQIEDVEQLQDDADIEVDLAEERETDDIELQKELNISGKKETEDVVEPQEDIDLKFNVISAKEIEDVVLKSSDDGDNMQDKEDENAIEPKDRDVMLMPEDKKILDNTEKKAQDTPEKVENINESTDVPVSAETCVSEVKTSIEDNDIPLDEFNRNDVEREPAVKFGEVVIDNDDEEISVPLMSPEDIENISDVIDDVINVGTRMSELISAERETDSNELDIGIVESESDNLQLRIADISDEEEEEEEEEEKDVKTSNAGKEPPTTNKISVEFKQLKPTESPEIANTNEDSSANVGKKPDDGNE